MKTLLAIVTALCLGACSRPELPPPAQAPPTQLLPGQAPAPTNKDPRAARELIASGLS